VAMVVAISAAAVVVEGEDVTTRTTMTTHNSSHSNHHMASQQLRDSAHQCKRPLPYRKLASLIHMPFTEATRIIWPCGIRPSRNNSSREGKAHPVLKLTLAPAVTSILLRLRLMFACLHDLACLIHRLSYSRRPFFDVHWSSIYRLDSWMTLF